ncbi:MAG TPA: hypothetical protein VF223_16815 [Trebonia sp.]
MGDHRPRLDQAVRARAGLPAWFCKRSSQINAIFAPGIAMIGNVITGVVLCYSGMRVLDGQCA